MNTGQRRKFELYFAGMTSDDPPALSTYMEERRRPVFIVFCFIAAPCGAMAVWYIVDRLWGFGFPTNPWLQPRIWPPVILTATAAQLFMHRYLRRRYLGWVRECEFSVCTSCGYRLAGLPAEGTCPECGLEYSSEELKRAWAATLD